ncbi:hypothetical protein QWY90_03270 [Flavobacterium paronense]|uniref:DUF3899 domain-containing protein n=1 Tax=Flavobacterium paronense TaxID=1392775 RepID=A0ABV5GFW3_9FLAO|nr:hypothetical protein [Flavobacterium paronense]MDN3676328.1 hypothetical protein [Flavobacterium paronense]
MSSITESRELECLIFCVLFALGYYYFGKWLHKDKLKSEEEFKKFVAENDSPTKLDYNMKKFYADRAAQRYRQSLIMKWFFIIGVIVFLFLLIFSNRS